MSEVRIPTGIGPVQLYTLTGQHVTTLKPEQITPLSCEGERVTVTEPEAYLLRMGSPEYLNVVRFESDTKEDGYYIDASLLNI